MFDTDKLLAKIGGRKKLGAKNTAIKLASIKKNKILG